MKKMVSFGIFVMGFVLGFFSLLGLNKVWENWMVCDVRLVKDIDLVEDRSFKGAPPEVYGILKKGSIGKQKFVKAGTVYIDFPIALSYKMIEYLNKK